MSYTENTKRSIIRDHADAAAVIGVQIATTALLISVMIWINSVMQSQITTVNTRQDTMNARMDTIQNLMYQEMKNFHGRLTILEERNPSFLQNARRVE